MQVKIGQTVSFVFCTADPSSGSGAEVTAATGTIWINGVANGATVTIVDDAGAVVGVRKVSYTVPSGLSEGDTVQCIITATVGGVMASSVMRDDNVVTKFPGELSTEIATKATQTSVNAIPTTNILTSTLTESYAADGQPVTLTQALYMLLAMQQQKAITGTTLTASKIDGTTPAMTFTLNDATSPTAITRTT